MTIELKKKISGSIPTPTPGNVTFFVGEDGFPKYKDESGSYGDFIGPPGSADYLVMSASYITLSRSYSDMSSSLVPRFEQVSSSLVKSFDDLSDVTITSADIDQFIAYNGVEWINKTIPKQGIGQGLAVYDTSTAILTASSQNSISVEQLSFTPSNDPESIDSAVVNNSTEIIGAYIFNADFGRSVIDAGIWDFTIYSAVDNTSSTSQIVKNIMRVRTEVVTVTITGTGTSRTATASGGTPFSVSNIGASAVISDASYIKTTKGLYQITARTSDTVVTITTPTGYVNETASAFKTLKKLFQVSTADVNSVYPVISEYRVQSIQPAYTLTPADSIGQIVFVRTDRPSNVTVYWVHSGQTHYSLMKLPLVTLHNDLPGLQGGAINDYFHLTNTQLDGFTAISSSYQLLAPRFEQVSASYASYSSSLTPRFEQVSASYASYSSSLTPRFNQLSSSYAAYSSSFNASTALLKVGGEMSASFSLPKASGSAILVNNSYAWRDLTSELITREAGPTSPAYSAFYGGSTRTYFFAAGEKADCSFHMPHDYAPGTDLYIHLHWSHNGTSISGQLVVSIVSTYARGHNSFIFSPEVTTTITVSTPDIATVPRYVHRIDEVQLSSLTPSASQLDTATLEPDGIIFTNITPTTIPTIGGGSPNEPTILFCDIHYQSTNIGTKGKTRTTFYT